MFLKIYNTDFDEIITKFTDQNDRLLEIEDKENMLKDMDFYRLQKNIKNIKGLDASKKVIHKADEYLENKTPDTTIMSNNDNIMK